MGLATALSNSKAAANLEPQPNGDGGRLRYLDPHELPTWDALVESSPQGSPLTRSWWLNAVGGTVSILVYFKHGRLLAGIPLYSEKRFGVTLLTMPKLTQTLGPVMAPASDEHSTAVEEEMEILSAFAQELAKYPIFFQAFHPTLHNWSPFYWNGFKQTCRATQILDLQSPASIFDNMDRRARRYIRKAEQSGVRVRTCDSDCVWHAEEKTFRRQQMKVPHSIEYLRQLYQAAKQNQSGDCFAAVDSQGRVHAALFMIWDKRRAIGVASGSDPELRSGGAMSLLMWHGIQFAAERSEIFDFGGSMLQPIEWFQRSFGTTQVPYMWIMRFPMWLKIYLTARGKI
jgi:hypothetical protein